MSPRALQRWLGMLCVLVVGMVLIGGITRLTGSGLSMVEWKPVSGVLPPLGEAAWAEEFARYQASPQYRLVNAGMTLEAFQRIFFWEYVHRVAGRVVALALIVPFALLALRRRLGGHVQRRLALASGLVLLQGAMGWYMVKSGLTHLPRVSHYRLAAHLSLALLLLSLLFWLLLTLRPFPLPLGEGRGEGLSPHRVPRASGFTMLALVALQLVYGAFMAGLHAGHMFSTFPTMNGAWVPAGLLAAGGLLENPVSVHFIHRALGLGVLLGAVALVWRARTGERHAAGCLLATLLLQTALGAATVLLHVPVWLAVLHQLGGCGVLLATLWLLDAQRRPGPLAKPCAASRNSREVPGTWQRLEESQAGRAPRVCAESRGALPARRAPG